MKHVRERKFGRAFWCVFISGRLGSRFLVHIVLGNALVLGRDTRLNELVSIYWIVASVRRCSMDGFRSESVRDQ